MTSITQGARYAVLILLFGIGAILLLVATYSGLSIFIPLPRQDVPGLVLGALEAAGLILLTGLLVQIEARRDERDQAELKIDTIELHAGHAFVTILNQGGRDGALKEAFTWRSGMDGKGETFLLDAVDPVPEGEGYGIQWTPCKDWRIASGDRRVFMLKPRHNVRRDEAHGTFDTERRPHVEVWFGTDTGPATLKVRPVIGKGDEKPMPVQARPRIRNATS